MRKLKFIIGKVSEGEHERLNILDSKSRSVAERIEFGLIPMKYPVLDDKPYRIFNSMEEYRQWAEKALPRYLGYYRNA